MADRGYGNIRIGGDVRASICEELLQVIRDDDGAGPESEDGIEHLFKDHGTKNFTPAQKLMELARISGDGLLFLCGGQAAGGMFDAIETFLMREGIPFDRHSDSLYENDAEMCYFRKDTGTVFMHSSNSGADAYVSADAVLKARQAVGEGNMHAALRLLDGVLGKFGQVNELPPFKIVDG